MTASVAESRPDTGRLRPAGTGVVLATLFTITGCTGPYSILDPASSDARAVAAVWWAMLAVALIVTAGVVWAWWHGSRRPAVASNPPATRRQAQRFMIWGGMVLPSVAIVALLAFGLPAGQHMESTAGDPGWEVNVSARQWVWEIAYPELPDRVVRNEIHLPVGVPVDFHVQSRDVIHGFWIPRLGGKIDAVPGRTNVWRLQADAPGVYRGVCAEYCGTGHAHMTLTVIALEADDFAAWQKDAGAAASLSGDNE